MIDQRNIKCSGSTCEKRLKLLLKLIMSGIAPDTDCAMTGLVQLFKLLRQSFAVGKFEKMDGRLITYRDHRTEWRSDPVGTQQPIFLQLRRRQPQNPGEGVAESIGRFKTGVHLGINDAVTLCQSLKPLPQSLLSRHLQKRNAEMSSETAAHRGWVKPHASHIIFTPTALRLRLQCLQ